MIKKRLQPVLGAVLSLCMASQAFALGGAFFGAEVVSTRSLGQGAVGVAGATDDTSSPYLNAAAMTALPGTQATADLTYINSRPSYAPASGSRADARATSVLVPDLAATTLLWDGKLALGLAMVTPFGAETHFNGDSPLRYVATDARLRVVDVSPSVALKINDQWSVGGGFDYDSVLEGQFDKKISESAINSQLTGTPTTSGDGGSDLNANGDGWGFHAGVTYQPCEHHKFGVAYHSLTKLSLSGNLVLTDLSGASAAVFGGSRFVTGTHENLYLPQSWQLGYAWTPNDKWMLEADAAWYNWTQMNQLAINYTGSLTPAQKAILQSGSTVPIGAHDTYNIGLGANYKQNDKLQWRGGFYFEPFAQSEAAFNPAFMDLSRYGLTAGMGYAVNKTVGIDLAYDAILAHSRYITNGLSTAAGGPPLSGNFSSFLQLVSASVTVKLPSL